MIAYQINNNLNTILGYYAYALPTFIQTTQDIKPIKQPIANRPTGSVDIQKIIAYTININRPGNTIYYNDYNLWWNEEYIPAQAEWYELMSNKYNMVMFSGGNVGFFTALGNLVYREVFGQVKILIYKLNYERTSEGDARWQRLAVEANLYYSYNLRSTLTEIQIVKKRRLGSNSIVSTPTQMSIESLYSTDASKIKYAQLIMTGSLYGVGGDYFKLVVIDLYRRKEDGIYYIEVS